MNNIIKILGLSSIVVIAGVACSKKYQGDTYDFSNTAKKYIKLTSGQSFEINAETVDTTIIDGTDTIEAYYHIPDEDPILLKVETREGLPSVVNYTVEAKSGSLVKSLSGTHPKFTLNSTVPFSIEESEFTDDEMEGTMTLTSAAGYDLQVGYPLAGNGVTVNFVAYKPYVIHEY